MTDIDEFSFVICLPTCKRPAKLELLLKSLLNQQFLSSKRLLLSVIIIDNDEAQSARSVYMRFSTVLSLRYVVEKMRGLSFVRNRAIDEALRIDAAFLCFIDDDEILSECWLDEMIKVQQQTGGECIYGPILSLLPPNTPDWVFHGHFFERPVFHDCEELTRASTGNLMLSCEFLRRTGLKFDDRFSVAGGEDSFFLMQAQKKFGLKIFGASKAVAYEAVPCERVTLRWILKRRFRIGNGLCLYERYSGASYFCLFIRAMKGVARILIGVLLIPAGLYKRHLAARGLQSIVFGLGMWAGLLGYVVKEYEPLDLVYARNMSC